VKLQLGPPVVTPWISPLDGTHAIGCPLCGVWSAIEPRVAGAATTCPRCAGVLHVSRAAVRVDWTPVARGWTTAAS